MCKVSVIMPVYNKGKYVEKAIQSVLQQTLQEWELLIVDDGSTDASYEICSEFNDNRIRLVRVENGGVSRARNIGLNLAKGEYVTFLDGDDYIEPTYLQTLYHPHAEMVVSGLTMVDLKGNFLCKVLPEKKGEKKIGEVAKTFYQEQIKNGIYGFVAGKMIKRELIEQNNYRFDERIHLAEDYEFFLKIYHCIDKILFLNDSGYCYVQETENSGIALDDSRTDFWIQIEIQNKTRKFLEEHQCFGVEEEKIYLKRVTGYIYTLFLVNQNIGYLDFCVLFEKLRELVPCTSNDIEGMGKICIFFYDIGWKRFVYILMKVRKLVRKLWEK